MRKFLSFCILVFLNADEENIKNGLFFGFGMGLKQVAIENFLQNQTDGDFQQEEWQRKYLEFGFRLGDQTYYTDRFGAKMTLYGGVGNSIENKVVVLDKEVVRQKFLPLSAGVDFDFLYDFINKDAFAFGLNFGSGYRFEYYKALNQGVYFVKNSIQSHRFFPQVGMHFYIKNHQITFNYRFGGVLYQNSKKFSMDVSGMEFLNLLFRAKITDYVALEYDYRF